MSSDIGIVILSGALPLLGVIIGSGSTVLVQKSSARESRIRTEAERRQSQRAEIKNAIDSYLKAAQYLQTQLYSREHGEEIPDVRVMVEDIWLAHAHLDIICSEGLRTPLTEHALALNEVARHEEQYPDWWEYVVPRKLALHVALRKELRWQEDEEFIEPRLSTVSNEVLSGRDSGTLESQSETREPGLGRPDPELERPGP
jgi:gas vesicle protein